MYCQLLSPKSKLGSLLIIFQIYALFCLGPYRLMLLVCKCHTFSNLFLSCNQVHEISPDGTYRCQLLGDHFANKEAQYQINVNQGHWYATELVDQTGYSLWSEVVIPGKITRNLFPKNPGRSRDSPAFCPWTTVPLIKRPIQILGVYKRSEIYRQCPAVTFRVSTRMSRIPLIITSLTHCVSICNSKKVVLPIKSLTHHLCYE